MIMFHNIELIKIQINRKKQKYNKIDDINRIHRRKRKLNSRRHESGKHK